MSEPRVEPVVDARALGDAYRPLALWPALGDGFFDEVRPAEFPKLVLRYRNRSAAREVGLDGLDDAAWLEAFGRFRPLPGSLPAPLALRYHGHQFRAYNTALGDGRGFVYAELRDARGRAMDLGTKGSGTTPWSRAGDGRLTLKGGVREALATEMLEALGVPTSRTLSVIETGEALARTDEPSPTRASVLVRLSHGHVRFGTFQRLAFARDEARLRKLLDFTLEHYLPSVAREPEETAPVRFFREVARRSAELVGAWLAAGFAHGVLNTDNMNVTGESFDYGPYRFVPRNDPAFVAAYFDHAGLYAFGRQAEAVRWNLERLADALALLARPSDLARELADFEARVMAAHHARFLARLGLRPLDAVSDAIAVERALCFLKESGLSFDRLFFDWWGGELSAERAERGPLRARYDDPRFRAARAELARHAPIVDRLPSYFAREAPATMLIDEVERVWAAIDRADDWGPFEALVADARALASVPRA